MQTNINWANLKNQGNVKDINIPWSTEEWEYISAGDGLAEKQKRVDAVRAGYLSVSEYEKAQAYDAELKAERTPHELSVNELLAKAKDLGVAYDSATMTYTDLADAVAESLDGGKIEALESSARTSHSDGKENIKSAKKKTK